MFHEGWNYRAYPKTIKTILEPLPLCGKLVSNSPLDVVPLLFIPCCQSEPRSDERFLDKLLDMSNNCPICNTSVPNFLPAHDKVECEVCGTYLPNEAFLLDLFHRWGRQKPDSGVGYLLSGVIREKVEAGIVPVLNDLSELQTQIPFKNDPLASIDRILLHIYRKSKSSADYLKLDPQVDYPIGYARDAKEFEFFMEKAKELGYIEASINTLLYGHRLSLKGWERVANLRLKQSDSRQAFVAMWFDKDMAAAFLDGFKPALEAMGYRPFRVDLREHNGKIDDLIIAEIRKSGLLIADFTGQRGGVYFEAGFAMGLGISVIWTCRSDDVEKLHFDTRQYNHIVWTDASDLREKLQLRIEASLPNRPR